MVSKSHVGKNVFYFIYPETPYYYKVYVKN